MSKAAEEDFIYRILKLECSFEAYQQLHHEELDELRRALAELKREMLALYKVQQAKSEAEVEYEVNVTVKESGDKS